MALYILSFGGVITNNHVENISPEPNPSHREEWACAYVQVILTECNIMRGN